MKTASVGGVQRCGFHSGPVLERDYFGGGGGGGNERGLRVRCEDKSGAFLGRNEGEWRAVISQEIRDGRGRQAVGMYEEMMRQRVAETSPHTLIALLKACGSAGDMETAKRMHAEVVRSGLESHLFVSTALVDAYMKCRSVADARHAFEAMPHRDAVSWTAMILGLAEMGKGEEALQLYAQMQQQQGEGGGPVADAQTYVAALKACRAALEGPKEAEEGASKDREGRCLKMVRSIHSDMVKKGGLQLGCGGSGAMVVVLGNMLVDVYARCGSLEDARRVFDKLPGRDVVSWNMMISGYAGQRRGGKGGGPQEALRLYRRMRQVEGVAPDARTYVAALKACSKLEEAGQSSLDMDEQQQQQFGGSSLEAVRAVHADVKESCKHNLYVENMLVDVYAKCGRLEEARRVFDEMPCRDVVCWNSMISGYAQMGEAEEALQLYRRMRGESGVVADARTFVAALKACSRLAGGESAGSGADCEVEEDKARRCVEVVRAVHADAAAAAASGEPLDVTNVFVGSLLVDVYAKCGRVEEGRRVFERMARRNVVSWNSLILGYAQMGMGEEALQVYSRMQEQGGSVVPNARTHVGALKACSSIMQAAAGAAAERGDDAAAACVSWRRQRSRCLEIARGIDACYNNKLKDGNAFVDTMLVDVYGKCGRVEDARRVFDGMGQRQQRDAVAWSAMILAYAQSEEGEGEGERHQQEALRLYKMLVAEQQKQVVGNSQMFVGALTACGRMAALDEGRQVHADMRRAAAVVEAEALVTVALIDMYAKCGSMAEARQVFDGTAMACKRNVTAWNALLCGYARVGEVEAVFALLDRMMRQEEGGVRPNGVTFLGVLTACSHAGLVDRGRDYLRLMSCPTSGYGIAPGVNHLACMVDLLGRAGRLDEALAVARSMPDPVPAAVWKSVLGACRMHAHAHGGGGGGAVDIACHAFRCAVQARPDDAAPYVLMANVYSAAGMEEAARATQARRLAAQAWKRTRGESRWTDPAGRTHVFAAGDAPSQGAQVRRMQAETDLGWRG